MSALKPGTLAYLVRLTGGLADFDGRVVEVLSGPVVLPHEQATYHRVAAAWIEEEFPGRDVFALQSRLRPITPPEREDEVRALEREPQGMVH